MSRWFSVRWVAVFGLVGPLLANCATAQDIPYSVVFEGEFPASFVSADPAQGWSITPIPKGAAIKVITDHASSETLKQWLGSEWIGHFQEVDFTH